MVSKVNFTKLTSFNIALLTAIEDVKQVKQVMTGEGATPLQKISIHFVYLFSYKKYTTRVYFLYNFHKHLYFDGVYFLYS